MGCRLTITVEMITVDAIAVDAIASCADRGGGGG